MEARLNPEWVHNIVDCVQQVEEHSRTVERARERGCVISTTTPTTQEAAVRCPRCPQCLSLSHCLCLSLFVCLPVECLVGPFSRQLFQGINIGIDGIDIDDCWPYLNGSLIDLLVVVMTAFVLRRESSGYLLSL